MPSSNILLFDANKANMMADEQYSTNTQRLNGVQSGIASSQLQNKTLYQVSLVAYAIAQIMNQNGLDANDTAAVSAFVANLSGTMLQKVADLATTQEAQAGVVTGKWMSPALVRAALDTYTSEKWLPLSGGTMLGNLILNADPTAALGAVTKQYADNVKTFAINLLVLNGVSSEFEQNLVTVSATTNFESANYSPTPGGYTPIVGTYFQYSFTTTDFLILRSENRSFSTGYSGILSGGFAGNKCNQVRCDITVNSSLMGSILINDADVSLLTDYVCPPTDFQANNKIIPANSNVILRYTVTNVTPGGTNTAVSSGQSLGGRFVGVSGLYLN